jgi:hypothetical protein
LGPESWVMGLESEIEDGGSGNKSSIQIGKGLIAFDQILNESLQILNGYRQILIS